jgi:hypothetical protein
VKKWIILLLVVAAGWLLFFRETPAQWRGMPATAEPQQTTNDLPGAFRNGRFTITPLARYSITAVVLSRCRYRFDPEAELSPLDLALAWGPMSIAGVINDLNFSQSGRWYEYRYSNEAPLDPQQMASHSANTHCLPANATVKRQLLAVKRHELVTLEGYLIEATTAEGYHWRSSLSREDTGGHACEVMWVTSVSRKRL